jgi:hypothetical protein
LRESFYTKSLVELFRLLKPTGSIYIPLVPATLLSILGLESTIFDISLLSPHAANEILLWKGTEVVKNNYDLMNKEPDQSQTLGVTEASLKDETDSNHAHTWGSVLPRFRKLGGSRNAVMIRLSTKCSTPADTTEDRSLQTRNSDMNSTTMDLSTTNSASVLDYDEEKENVMRGKKRKLSLPLSKKNVMQNPTLERNDKSDKSSNLDQHLTSPAQMDNTDTQAMQKLVNEKNKQASQKSVNNPHPG